MSATWLFSLQLCCSVFSCSKFLGRYYTLRWSYLNFFSWSWRLWAAAWQVPCTSRWHKLTSFHDCNGAPEPTASTTIIWKLRTAYIYCGKASTFSVHKWKVQRQTGCLGFTVHTKLQRQRQVCKSTGLEPIQRNYRAILPTIQVLLENCHWPSSHAQHGPLGRATSERIRLEFHARSNPLRNNQCCHS